jgi:LPXTG-motif cell wall-anchored protein
MSNNAQSSANAQAPSGTDANTASTQSSPSSTTPGTADQTTGATTTTGNDQNATAGTTATTGNDQTAATSRRHARAGNQGNLPQTASNLPFVGLLGLGLLAAGLVSSRKRKAPLA